MGINHPGGIIKNLIGVIMAGVLGIFGLIVAIIIGSAVTKPTEDGMTTYSEYNAWRDLCAGVCCGMTCLAAGWATGVAGERGRGGRAKRPKGGRSLLFLRWK